jgi:hypothetical protein
MTAIPMHQWLRQEGLKFPTVTQAGRIQEMRGREVNILFGGKAKAFSLKSGT